MPRITRYAPAPIAVAMTVYRTWRRLPQKQRAQLLGVAKAHGPRLAAAAAGAAKARALRSRRGRPPG